MFPRAFFAGRFFAPRFFPQSEGVAPAAGSLVCGTPRVLPRVSGVAAVTPRVSGTAGVVRC